jgi:uncharacterized protein (DUF1015 family)
MTELVPFIGTRYNSRLIEDMKMVIGPYGDAMCPETRKKICLQHPYNIMHIIPAWDKEEGEEYNNSYLRAGNIIQKWHRDGILVNDNHKCLYLYEQIFSKPINGCKSRRGIYALTNVHSQKPKKLFLQGTTPYSNKSCHLKLLRATKCNFAPLSLLFHDPQDEFDRVLREITASKPWEEFQDAEQNTHRLWVLNKKEIISQITLFFHDKETFVVEGHDRFEIALQYSREQREATGKTDGLQPFDHILVFLSRFEEGCLTTKPIHRVLSSELGSGTDIPEILDDLSESFTIKPIKVNLKNTSTATIKILQTIAEKDKKEPTLAMVLRDGRAFTLSLKPKITISDLYDEEIELSNPGQNLHVNILYHHIIRQIWIGNPELELEEEDVQYFDDAEAALKKIVQRKASAAFLLNPCPMKQITDVVDSGDMIPPFAVRLHPPLPTGLVIRDISIRH